MTKSEARKWLALFGANVFKLGYMKTYTFAHFLAQYAGPIIILIFADTWSFILQDPISAFRIPAIVLTSGLLGF